MDFRIIDLSKRPHRQMLLRRDIDDNGKDIVIAEMFVPREGDEGDWWYGETTSHGDNGAAMAGSHIAEFSEGAAKAFYIRAKADAERNSIRPEAPPM